ncbi:MAG: TonB-dependent receptor [Treponema sp.]|nr:TonB-dependent receptor [Treponema sp.]
MNLVAEDSESIHEIRLPDLFTYISLHASSSLVEQRQVYTAEEIEKLEVQDLPSLMAAAGVQLISYGPYGLEQKPSIRGFTDETVRVIVDGICVNNAQYGTFDFSSLNVDNIEKIEIIRGGFTEGVQDEGAVGGAIYIFTKKQQLGHHFFAQSSVSSFFNAQHPIDTFSQSLSYNGQLGNSSFIKANGKGTFAQNKYLYNDYKDLLLQRENASVLDGNANCEILHFFGDGNTFSINNLFYGGKKHTPGQEYSANPGIQKDFDNNLTMQVIFPLLADCLRLENSMAWLSNIRFYEDKVMIAKNTSSEHYVNTLKYVLSGNYYKYDFLKESFGLTFDYTNLSSTDDGKHNQFSGAVKNTVGVKTGLFSLTFPLAFRFCNQNVALIPKVGTVLNFSHVDFLLDAYKMLQFPNMDDLYWNDGLNYGNPNLKPEEGWGGDFTINVHDVWLPFSVCAFTNYYKNKIQWAGSEVVKNAWTPQNVAKAFYFGIDGSFEKSFWQNKLVLKGNGEYLYTSLLNKNSPSTYKKRIMLTPDFVASFSASFNFPKKEKLPGFSMTIDGNYVGKRYTKNINTNYLEPYFLLNTSIEASFFKNDFEIVPYAKVENLLNTQYQTAENYPMPGMSLSVGVKIKN